MTLHPNASDQGRIPFRLRIGVTGHRRLPDEGALAEQVRRALQRIRELLPSSPYTPVLFTVISPLAEGADRLVAREVLKSEGADLEAPLPLPREEYLRDFQSDESKREFDDLLSRAREITELGPSESREKAYERVGHYVVDRCDVLIALWDGEPPRGQGGTAEIVEYARDQGAPLMWISTKLQHDLTEELESGLSKERCRRLWEMLRRPRASLRSTTKGQQVAEEPENGQSEERRRRREECRAERVRRLKGTLRQLGEYNRGKIAQEQFRQEVRQQEGQAATAAGLSRVDALLVRAFSEWVLPYYVRADLLAQRYQTWYYALGNALFLLAAAAVAAAASQFLFVPETPELVWIEVGLMLGLLAIVGIGRGWRFHDRWLSYRFLTERFRSALFLAASGLGSRRAGLERVYLGHPSEEWLRQAFAEVWKERPKVGVTESGVEGFRRFLAEAWIEDQIGYHSKMSPKYYRRHHRLTRISELLFVATVAAAVLHAFSVTGHATPGSLSWATLFVLLAVALPALGAGIYGIRTQREYLRNSERFERMAHYLKDIKTRMEAAPNMDTVRQIAAEAEDLMLDENRDWFVVMKFHPFELNV